jgi:hypothetical protein
MWQSHGRAMTGRTTMSSSARHSQIVIGLVLLALLVLAFAELPILLS